MGADDPTTPAPAPAPGPGPEPISEAQKWLNKLGNVEGFAKLVLYYAVALIVVGYVGATMINVCNMTGEEIDYMFPSNLQSYPYMVPANESNPPSNTISDIFKEFHANQDAESLTRATIEVVYPMRRQGFPYSSWFLSPEFQGDTTHTISQWFASTCAGTFCAWRAVNKKLIVLAKWFHTVINPLSDYVLFFIFPFIAIYVVMLPLIPVIGFFLSIFASAMYNIPGAWMFTFAPIMGFLLAISNLYTGGIMNIFAWGMSLLIFIFGFVMGFVNLAWWAMIGIALWAYTIVFMVISPLLHKGGIMNVINEFKKKRKALSILFVILVFVAALSTLSDTLKTGIGIGSLLCIFLILKGSNKTSATIHANPPGSVSAKTN